MQQDHLPLRPAPNIKFVPRCREVDLSRWLTAFIAACLHHRIRQRPCPGPAVFLHHQPDRGFRHMPTVAVRA
jgi:hypothetical protein